MTFGLHPIEQVFGGGIFFDGADASAVLHAYAGWTQAIPDELCTSLAFLRLPPIPQIPEPLRGRFTMHLRVAYHGVGDAGDALVAPMRACAPAVLDTLGTMPYSALDSIHQDPPEPVRFEEAGGFAAALTPDLQRLLLEQAGPGAECPFLLLEVRHLGGALREGGAGAVGHRDAGFHLLAVEVPRGPGSPLTGAAERFRGEVAAYTTGYFVNLCGGDGGAQLAQRCWSGDQYRRLVEVKRAYDPASLFQDRLGLVSA